MIHPSELASDDHTLRANDYSRGSHKACIQTMWFQKSSKCNEYEKLLNSWLDLWSGSMAAVMETWETNHSVHIDLLFIVNFVKNVWSFSLHRQSSILSLT